MKVIQLAQEVQVYTLHVTSTNYTVLTWIIVLQLLYNESTYLII